MNPVLPVIGLKRSIAFCTVPRVGAGMLADFARGTGADMRTVVPMRHRPGSSERVQHEAQHQQ